MEKDYYEILGVPRDAGSDTIDEAMNRAYNQFLFQGGGLDQFASQLFDEAREAYGVLSDPEKRQIYDAYGIAGLKASEKNIQNLVQQENVDFDWLFQQAFGAADSQQATQPINRSVFISYSRKDADIATFIAKQLETQGVNVFIDYEQLIGGEDFKKRLAKEISNRDSLVFLMSERSINSKWVNAEVDWAFSHNKLIIPVMLEMVTFENFMYLVSVQQIDFTGWKPQMDMSAPLAKLFRALAGQ